MTVTNNGVPTSQEATNRGEVKTHNSISNRTKQLTRHWKLTWATYACEEQDGRSVPMDVKETFFSLKPSQSEIDQLRKMAHARGYKLVSINPCDLSQDEF